jgi:hypothetical protein
VLFYCSDETVYSMYLWKKNKTFYIWLMIWFLGGVNYGYNKDN